MPAPDLSAPPLTPFAGLALSAREYLDGIAAPAVDAAIAEPTSRARAVAACIVLFHVLDWAAEEDLATEAEFLAACPFGWPLKAFALGGKHRTVVNHAVRNAESTEGVTRRGYGQGPYGVGPYGAPIILTNASRLPGEEARSWQMTEVLSAALEWWRSRIAA